MNEQLAARKRWLALMVVCLGVLMIVLDITIVNVALPSIKADLGFSETALVWVVNAYLLTAVGCALLARVTGADSFVLDVRYWSGMDMPRGKAGQVRSDDFTRRKFNEYHASE